MRIALRFEILTNKCVGKLQAIRELGYEMTEEECGSKRTLKEEKKKRDDVRLIFVDEKFLSSDGREFRSMESHSTSL
ncbi:hypothetical protein V2J09_008966 [Rumex salicifolius]